MSIKLRYILPVFLILFGCASKRYAKKGLEFEQAGMYNQAAEMYYQSVVKNPKNVEAQIGLKKNGQMALDNELGKFLNYYNADQTKDAVFKFRECDQLFKKYKSVGTELNLPSHYKDYYNEVKVIYLENRYNEAYLLLTEEQYAAAEDIFNEILTIQPGYQDVNALINTAHYEPIYREAKELMNLDKYRKSYYKFQEILKHLPNYKDAKELNDNVLDKATLTIVVIDFKNKSRYHGTENEIKAEIQKALNNSDFPFIKLIDRENTDEILSEQLYALEGNTDENLSAKAGKMLGAKALLTGIIINYNVNEGNLNKELKKGYIKEKIVKKKGEEKIVTYKYNKTTYNEFSMNREVSCRFQYKLISTETGEILVTDAISRRKSDQIHYAKFEGDTKNLVPGYWVKKSSKSPKDVINDDAASVNELKRLLQARKKIKTVNQLKTEIYDEIAQHVTKKIEQYDPEN